MLKAFQEGLRWDKWEIRFCTPHNKEWGGDFVGNVYRSNQLKPLDSSDSYEFYYYDPSTSEIIQMFFRNQQELMKFLAYLGWELRRKGSR